MTRDLIARAAAAQAAADAEAVSRCKWCRDGHDLHDLPHGEYECGDPDACHARFDALNQPTNPEGT